VAFVTDILLESRLAALWISARRRSKRCVVIPGAPQSSGEPGIRLLRSSRPRTPSHVTVIAQLDRAI
jgi:hypothetical protein